MSSRSLQAPPRVIALAGATTTAGTTALTAQLGVAVAAAGARVAAWSPIDTNPDLATVLGVEPTGPGAHVTGPCGLTLLGLDGFESVSTPPERRELLDRAEGTARAFEVLLVDLGCPSDDTLLFGAAADDLVLVLPATIDAVGDADAFVRRLTARWGSRDVHVLVHGATNGPAVLGIIHALAAGLADLAPRLLPLEAVGRQAGVAELAGVAAVFLGPCTTRVHGGIQFFFEDHLSTWREC